MDLVEDAGSAADHVDVPEGDRVERPRNDSDPAHALTLSGGRYAFVTVIHAALC
jgi:hypothetical protein